MKTDTAATPPQTTQCQWCYQTVAVVPCAMFLMIDDHNRPATGRQCPGTGVVVGRRLVVERAQ